MKSTVKWFNKNKGYGFIKNPEPSAQDIFVHFTAIKGKGYRVLEQDEEVVFDLVQTPKGPQAFSVRKNDESQQTGEEDKVKAVIRPTPAKGYGDNVVRSFRFSVRKPGLASEGL